MDEPGLRGPNAESGLRGPNAEPGSSVADRHDPRAGLPPVAAAMLGATADPAAVPLEAAAALERRFRDRPVGNDA